VIPPEFPKRSQTWLTIVGVILFFVYLWLGHVYGPW